ncbi:sulfotransferase family 2 domain-containing protein [Catenovulum sp. SM1970]|uniref:sulfotransferase family 2 domain-containing protein n=1 Tax=Marinifaba aquimaris TaxID=2741323 RepID=UPI001572C7F1|nr:sulfotransferase family 2 domain-containing protein [Marinifaba aquimaris]NTS78777.1 sulfotransferase family 2 domain-containing protein [Marinifaba aquimaris]
MLLSHKHNFLFIHIAKTGGTSVRSALAKYRWGHLYSFAAFLARKLSGFTGHKIGSKFPRHCKAIAAKEMLPGEYYSQLYKFCVVRNPFDLQVSSYHHIEKEHPQIFKRYNITNFAEFLAVRLDSEREFEELLHAPLQSDYVVDLHGNIIVDKICRFENLQADFDEACDAIGIARVALPHKRKAKARKTYHEYYSEKEIALVEKHYAKDLEILGYQFD